jgi:tetratricopeptide (TPR) repeat protein
VGDLRSAVTQRGEFAFTQVELGAYDQATRTLREVLEVADRLGRLHYATVTAKQNLGLALARLGALEEARAVEGEALGAFEAKGDKRMEGGSRIILAEILMHAGELDSARNEAVTAVRVLSATPPAKAHALAMAAQINLARGDVPAALDDAQSAKGLLDEIGVLDEGESLVRLVWAEALHAGGRADEAQEAIADARDRLMTRAERIRDPALRKSFLENVPENAKTLELATSWPRRSA